MTIEFIYDEKLDKAKKDLSKVVKVVKRTPLHRNGLFLRRFFFACVKAVEIKDRQKLLKRHKDEFKKLRVRRRLPTPPGPIIQMLHPGLPPLPEPPNPVF